MVDRMETTPHPVRAVDTDVSRGQAVAPPAVVRGWLYDPTEHWWALLVGAPPTSG